MIFTGLSYFSDISYIPTALLFLSIRNSIPLLNIHVLRPSSSSKLQMLHCIEQILFTVYNVLMINNIFQWYRYVIVLTLTVLYLIGLILSIFDFDEIMELDNIIVVSLTSFFILTT